MKHIFLIFLALFAFYGCSSSKNVALQESEKALNFSVANSKKVEIVHDDTSKTYITVTYLNPIKHELINQDSEKFVVGTYMATGEKVSEKIKLSNFEVNGEREELKISALAKDAKILSVVPSSNPWTEYVLVEAPSTLDINMTFSFESDQSKRVSLVFQKDY